MSKLAIAIFNHPARAETVMGKIPFSGYGKGRCIDACAVTRDREGTLSLRQRFDNISPFVWRGLVTGGAAGLLLGFATPHGWWIVPTGLFWGGVLGAILGALNDYGINNELIERLGSHLRPDTSALFLLYRDYMPVAVMEMLERERGFVMETILTRNPEPAFEKGLDHLRRSLPRETDGFVHITDAPP